MPSGTFFQEIKRFFKENLKIYSAFCVLGILLFGVLLVVQNVFDSKKVTVEIDKDSRMASFVFYVENSLQGVYNNSNFLDTVFLSEEFVQGAEKETGVEIGKLIDEQLNSDFVPTLLDRGYIGVGRDVHDETLLFQANLGSEEENLAVANYYYNLVINDEIPFLQNKEVYVVRKPYLVDLEENLANSDPAATTPSLAVTILKGMIFGIVGLVIGIIFVFLYHLLTKKINYSFSYEFDIDDQFYIERKDRATFLSTLLHPNFGKKLILCQQDLSVDLQKDIKKYEKENYSFTNQLAKINPNENFQEIIFVIVENQTDKEWYYRQREALKSFSERIKIIQVPQRLVQ